MSPQSDLGPELLLQQWLQLIEVNWVLGGGHGQRHAGAQVEHLDLLTTDCWHAPSPVSSVAAPFQADARGARRSPAGCSKCGRRFESLRDYLENTEHVGLPVSYDAEAGDWMPFEPIGTVSLANCSCDTTIAISSRKMNLITMWRLMRWARKECVIRCISMRQLLEHIRLEIDKQVLGSHSHPPGLFRCFSSFRRPAEGCRHTARQNYD